MEYLKNALEITNKLGVEMTAEFLKNDYHFEGDTQKRDIYKITLKRGSRKFSFNFGQSINNSGFYAKQGRCITNLDRKYLDKDVSKIFGLLPMPFNRKCDIIQKTIEPNIYDVMACLQKYDVGIFEDFCNDFGYDTDSKKAEKIYKSVLKEYQNMAMMFSDEELELLNEIQ